MRFQLSQDQRRCSKLQCAGQQCAKSAPATAVSAPERSQVARTDSDSCTRVRRMWGWWVTASCRWHRRRDSSFNMHQREALYPDMCTLS